MIFFKHQDELNVPSEEDVEPLVHVRLVAGDQFTQRLKEQGKNLHKN